MALAMWGISEPQIEWYEQGLVDDLQQAMADSLLNVIKSKLRPRQL
jgi:hypothetical protein